ncbi:glycerol acyltransferase [bacterium CPR1]|nr:glycerol acyltransferase [bacterium CPR1]
MNPFAWTARSLTDLTVGLAGWRFEGELPSDPRYVLLGAPHTSTWDFFLLMAVRFHWNMHIRWMGKHSMFRGPLGPLMRALGGLPIKRDERHNTVAQVVEMIHRHPRIVIGLAPQGTRNPAARWKSGFYRLMPTGDIQADMRVLAEFYGPLKGVCPEKTAPVRLADAPSETGERVT